MSLRSTQNYIVLTILSCQRDVGMYINIRKCHVLYLSHGKGAWAAAPYLDKHGETDSGLR